MATLIPFSALRPVPGAAAQVAAVPYDVVDAAEAKALAAGNPLSFLHVSRAEIDLPESVNPYSDEVYARAVGNFVGLRNAAPLVVEDTPSLYVYRLRMGTHVQTGIAGTFSVDEYERDIIKKHEKTRRDKEDDRTRHILELRAQTGPVFLTYRASTDVDAIVARAMNGSPLFDFTAVDGVAHTIWQVPAADVAGLVAAFGRIPALYIADGHHRAASAARTRQQIRSSANFPGPWDAFLAVAFPDNQAQILPYNRVIKDLAGHTPASLLDAMRAVVGVAPGPAVPRRRGEVGMYLDGAWYAIDLGTAPSNLPAADRLDVSRLQDLILTPLLTIGDVRSDKRIDFVGGARGTSELERRVADGRAAVAFSMHPVGVDELMQISDDGGIMPPKSTWFEPKLRDGLLSHLI
jgi:uncharacterized protein (DUF1015 family)